MGHFFTVMLSPPDGAPAQSVARVRSLQYMPQFIVHNNVTAVETNVTAVLSYQ